MAKRFKSSEKLLAARSICRDPGAAPRRRSRYALPRTGRLCGGAGARDGCKGPWTAGGCPDQGLSRDWVYLLAKDFRLV